MVCEYNVIVTIIGDVTNSEIIEKIEKAVGSADYMHVSDLLRSAKSKTATRTSCQLPQYLPATTTRPI